MKSPWKRPKRCGGARNSDLWSPRPKPEEKTKMLVRNVGQSADIYGKYSTAEGLDRERT